MGETMTYTVKEVDKMLHCSSNYVYSLIENDYLPTIKLSNVKILKSSLEQYP